MFTDILWPVLMLAGITFIAVGGRFLIRYAGKKYGIDTKDLEESLEQGREKASESISKLNKTEKKK